MALDMGRVLSTEPEQTSSSATEYRERYMSPRRDDYIPNVALPKINSARSSANPAFLSFDFDPTTPSNPSEYRLCFPNHRPKRPYVFHAQPSHVFDYVPSPIDSKPSSRLSAIPYSNLKNTEYQERFPNYSSFIPTQELIPPHLSGKANTQSDTQQKRERMTRSQYFHELVVDQEKLTGGPLTVGKSEQRSAFQWPNRFPPTRYKQFEQEKPPTVYPPYYTPRNIYEPLPPVRRKSINSFN